MSREKLTRLKKLFAAFFKIGALTFGGGLAMLPLIHREAVENNGWITEDEMLDVFAIAEATPGPVAVNSATFVGYKVAGVGGSALATFALALPPFVIIVVLSFFIEQFKSLALVAAAFRGIRVGVVVLIVGALCKLSKKLSKTLFNIGMAVAAFALCVFLQVDSIYILLGAIAAGLLHGWIVARRKGGAP